MRTAIIIALGFALLGICLTTGFFTGGAARLKGAALVFMALWFVAAAANLTFGVVRAGYTIAEELPFFLLIFCVPAAVAFYLQRGSRG
jgi:hypothetical protein